MTLDEFVNINMAKKFQENVTWSTKRCLDFSYTVCYLWFTLLLTGSSLKQIFKRRLFFHIMLLLVPWDKLQLAFLRKCVYNQIVCG